MEGHNPQRRYDERLPEGIYNHCHLQLHHFSDRAFFQLFRQYWYGGSHSLIKRLFLDSNEQCVMDNDHLGQQRDGQRHIYLQCGCKYDREHTNGSNYGNRIDNHHYPDGV